MPTALLNDGSVPLTANWNAGAYSGSFNSVEIGNGAGLFGATAVSGTNVAGTNLKIYGGNSTGNQPGGSILFQTAAKGTSGSSSNTLTTAVTIDSTGTLTSAVASGTNVTGNDLLISGGISTGNASGGNILLKTTPAGSSGANNNTPVTALTIDPSGNLTMGVSSGQLKVPFGSLAAPSLSIGNSGTGYSAITNARGTAVSFSNDGINTGALLWNRGPLNAYPNIAITGNTVAGTSMSPQFTITSLSLTSTTGNLNGTTLVQNLASMTGISVGQTVWNANIPVGTIVNQINAPGDPANSLRLSAAATGTATGTTIQFGPTPGMAVSGAGLPSGPTSELALVASVTSSTATVTIPGQNVTGNTYQYGFSSSNTGATYTFSDPGTMAFVMGNENVPCVLAVSGNNLTLNSSDWAIPQQNSITGGSLKDSVVYGSDYADPVGHGGAIIAYARNATNASQTVFMNQGFISGSINPNGGSYVSWTIGTGSSTTASTPALTFGDSTTGLYRSGTNQIAFTANGAIAMLIDAGQNVYVGRTLAFNVIGTSGTRNTISTGTNSDYLVVTGDATDLSGANGAAIILNARSATNANQTIFKNQAFQSGSIVSNSGTSVSWTIGATTSDLHNIYTATATTGSATLTMTNGPAGLSSNNAAGYIKIQINGTTRYMPYWS